MKKSTLQWVRKAEADRAVALISQHGFEETDLRGLAEIQNAETVLRDPAPGIAEAARRLAVAERVGIPIQVDAAEMPAG